MVLSALPSGLAWLSTKPVRVIRMTAVLLVCCLHLSASFSQSVTLNVKNAPLKEVFAALKKQTGFSFFYNAALLTDSKPVTLNMQNASLPEVLKAAFNGQPLNYVIENKTVFISRSTEAPKANTQKNLVEIFYADTMKVRVTDALGEPLSGATVTIKKNNKSGVTDSRGFIIVNANPGDLVSVSYVGYASQELKLGDGKNALLVALQPKANTNEEVVVLAYGQRKKKTDIIGSATQINADRIATMPSARIDALLEAQMPGVRITFNNDDASSTKQRINVRVRGTGSFSASNEPLWVIDGTPVYTGDRTNLIAGMNTGISPLSYLNPADIESITVLKDASAAAIYGANASNGVVLITTKSTGKGKAQFNVLVQNGFSKINKSTKFKTLNGPEYLELAKESYLNAGKDLSTFPYNDNDLNSYSKTNTDWADEFYGTGVVNDINLSMSGGLKKFGYMLSGGYYNNKSTIKGNTQGRASLRANLDYKFNDKLSINLISRYSYNKNNTFNPGMDYLDFLPIYSPYNNDGTYRLYNKKLDGYDAGGNPVYVNQKFFNSVAAREENDDLQKGNVVNNNFMVNYKIFPWLRSTTQVGVDWQETEQNIYKARTNWTGMGSAGEPLGEAGQYYNKTITKTLNQRLNFSKSYGFHNLSALAGLELNAQKYKTHSIRKEGFDDDNHRDVEYGKRILGQDSGRNESRSASYFGQLEYNYDRLYFVQFTGRRDGSSTFGSDARWGNFASAGVGWNIKKNFLEKYPWIDVLRVDATYGNTGNSRLSNQESLGIYTFSSTYNYDGQPGGVIFNIPNRLLRWETARQTNLKMNLGLFDRINLLVEAYRKKTIDAIVDVPVTRATGKTAAQSNTGELLNEGLEVTLRWDVIKNEKKGLSWSIEVNGAHNRNKALKLYNENDKVNGNYIWREGYDIQTFYLIRWAGVDPRDGAPLWYDGNGNLTRIYSVDNRVAGKSANPDVYGGVRTQFEYKNFMLTALFSYTIGGYQFSSFSRNINSDGLNIEADNQSVNQLDRWQQPGDIAVNPKPIWGVSTRSTMNSTRFVYNTTNLRLSNLALGYKFPEEVVKKLGVKGCNVNLIGNELFFVTPYDKSNRNSFKQSRSGYPTETSFLLAINVNF